MDTKRAAAPQGAAPEFINRLNLGRCKENDYELAQITEESIFQTRMYAGRFA